MKTEHKALIRHLENKVAELKENESLEANGFIIKNQGNYFSVQHSDILYLGRNYRDIDKLCHDVFYRCVYVGGAEHPEKDRYPVLYFGKWQRGEKRNPDGFIIAKNAISVIPVNY